jgi:ferredoxin
MNILHTLFKKRGHIVRQTGICVFCGKCEKACFFNALSVDEEYDSWLLYDKKCYRCKTCIKRCPQKALELVNQNKTKRRKAAPPSAGIPRKISKKI